MYRYMLVEYLSVMQLLSIDSRKVYSTTFPWQHNTGATNQLKIFDEVIYHQYNYITPAHFI